MYIPYSRPLHFSDPGDDFSLQELENIIQTPDSEIGYYELACIFQTYLPAGIYEECVYFLPIALSFLCNHSEETRQDEGRTDICYCILFWIKENKDYLKKDNLFYLIINKIYNIYLSNISSYSIKVIPKNTIIDKHTTKLKKMIEYIEHNLNNIKLKRSNLIKNNNSKRLIKTYRDNLRIKYIENEIQCMYYPFGLDMVLEILEMFFLYSKECYDDLGNKCILDIVNSIHKYSSAAWYFSLFNEFIKCGNFSNLANSSLIMELSRDILLQKQAKNTIMNYCSNSYYLTHYWNSFFKNFCVP